MSAWKIIAALWAVVTLVGMARADTCTDFPIANTADEDSAFSAFGPSYPPAFSACEGPNKNNRLAAKDNDTGGFVSVTLLRWDTSSIGAATVTSAELRLKSGAAGCTDDDGRNFTGEWFNWSPSCDSSDYTTNNGSDAFSVSIASIFTDCNTPLTALTFTLGTLTSINTSGITYMRTGISGGAPSGFNEASYKTLFSGGGNAPVLHVCVADAPTETPSNTPVGPTFTPTRSPTITQTPTITPTPTLTPTATPVVISVDGELTRSNSNELTVPSDIDACSSVLVSVGFRCIDGNSCPVPPSTITDSVGNVYACQYGNGGGLIGTGTCPCCGGDQAEGPAEAYGDALCFNVAVQPMPAGTTLTFPVTSPEFAFNMSLVVAHNLDTGGFICNASSVAQNAGVPDCFCGQNGQTTTVGGYNQRIAPLSGTPIPICVPSGSGFNAYYGEPTCPTSVSGGDLIWTTVRSQLGYTPLSGNTMLGSAPLTELYQIQPSTGAFVQGGNSATQTWTTVTFDFAPRAPNPDCLVAFTPTPTETPSLTPVGATYTPTGTPTRTGTWTPSPTITDTATSTETSSPTRTPTPSYTPIGATYTATRTRTVTLTPVLTPTSTLTETPSLTPVGATYTPTITPTVTQTPTITLTPVSTNCMTLTPTLTRTPTPTPTRTPTPTVRRCQTLTPTPGLGQCPVLLNSLLALQPSGLWRFDETTGTTATDEIGGNDGTYTGQYTLTGQGVTLNGLGSVVTSREYNQLPVTYPAAPQVMTVLMCARGTVGTFAGFQPAQLQSHCCGDCNGDGYVSGDEAQLCANILVGAADVSACPGCICADSGTISGGTCSCEHTGSFPNDDTYYDNFLYGCPAEPINGQSADALMEVSQAGTLWWGILFGSGQFQLVPPEVPQWPPIPIVSDGVEHLMVGTLGANFGQQTYLDGRLVDTKPNKFFTGRKGLWTWGASNISGWPSTTAQGYFGHIDLAAWWNGRQLTAAEISGLIPTVSGTPTPTPTITKTPTSTTTPTPTRPTRTPTPTFTRTPTKTPTITSTPTVTPTPTITSTPTFTPTITQTPTPTQSPSPTPT